MDRAVIEQKLESLRRCLARIRSKQPFTPEQLAAVRHLPKIASVCADPGSVHNCTLINFRHFICALGLLVADLLAWGLSFELTASGYRPELSLYVLSALWVAWFLVFRRKYFRRLPFWTELLGLLKGVLAFMALGCLGALINGELNAVGIYARWGFALAVLLPIGRAAARRLLNAAGVWKRSALIFGSGENASQAALALSSEPALGYALQAFIVPPGGAITIDSIRNIAQRSWPQTAQDFELLRAHRCVIALEANQSDLRDQLIRQLSQYQVGSVSVIPAMRGVATTCACAARSCWVLALFTDR